MTTKTTVFGKSFWDLWFQKVFRNLASVKYQFMVAFFNIIVYGMFFAKDQSGNYIISPVEGLSFLAGGFLSLATTRIIMRTSLIEPKDDQLNTDQ